MQVMISRWRPIAVLTLSCGGVLVLASLGCGDRPSRVRFDSASWKATAGNDSVRAGMVNDLLSTHDFHGRTKDEVLNLLGKPLQRTPAEAGFPQWDIVYLVGIEGDGVLAIDDRAIGFRFDATGRVVDYGLSVN